MPQPLLDLGNVRVVLQRTGGRSRPQDMRPHVLPSDAHLVHVTHHYFRIHPARRQGRGQVPRTLIAHWPEQWPIQLQPMPSHLQIFTHQPQ